MRRPVRLAICPLWDPPIAEITERARHRSTLARIELADRAIEREWSERVRCNLAARAVRRAIRYLNQAG